MVGLDLLRGLRLGRRGLDDVRVERPLGQEVDPAELRRLLLEDPDELVADDPSLRLRVGHPGQAGQEARPGVDHDEAHPEALLERDTQELRLLLAHQPVVHVDAGEPVPDRAVHQARGDRRIHAAGERADHQAVPTRFACLRVHPRTDLGDRRFDEVGGGPRRPGAGDPHHEVAQHVAAARRVPYLGMELDPVQAPDGVGHRGELRGRRPGRGPETGRRRDDRVAVAHPDRLLAAEPREQRAVAGERDRRGAVLALRDGDHVAAELACHQVQPVADPQDGDARAPHGRVRTRCIGLVDARRPAGEDDRARTALRDLAPRRVEGQELRVDMQLPDAPRNQLRVLAPKVEDHDGVGLAPAALPTGDGPTGAVDRGAFGRGRIERGLEVGLHLRVVRGEDTMAGVGELSVNGLAALASGGLVVVGP